MVYKVLAGVRRKGSTRKTSFTAKPRYHPSFQWLGTRPLALVGAENTCERASPGPWIHNQVPVSTLPQVYATLYGTSFRQRHRRNVKKTTHRRTSLDDNNQSFQLVEPTGWIIHGRSVPFALGFSPAVTLSSWYEHGKPFWHHFMTRRLQKNTEWGSTSKRIPPVTVWQEPRSENSRAW